MGSGPSIGFKISWIARMLRTRFDARARTAGLTRAQWRMIVTIRHAEGVTQSQLASQLEVNSVTAGRILDRLEAVGCIDRRADPIDRRVNRVYLTPDAMPMLEKLGELGAEEEQITVKGLSAEEQQLLESLLQRMIDNLQNAPALDAVADAEDFESTI